MKQEGVLDTSMGMFYMAKTHRLHIKSGAEKQQNPQGIFSILLNHLIRIQ